MFLRNHDELTLEMVTDEERDYMWRVYANDPTARINLGIRRRLAPLLANSRRKIELLNILLFSMPGTPVLYYGDEIGMGDNFYLGDRNGCRTPMQWSADRNAGFSKANPQQLYLPITIDPEYHYEAINVENQQKNLSSLLWWMRRVIAMRKNYKAFSRGSLEFLFPENPKVLAFLRRTEDETILVVVNLSRFAQPVELDLAKFSGCIPMEVFSRNRFPADPKIALSSYARAARALLVCIAVSLGGNPRTETHENTYHRIGAGDFQSSFPVRHGAISSARFFRVTLLVADGLARKRARFGNSESWTIPWFRPTRLARAMSSLK